jgi:glycosyltransferase involved in cell wall biosynthesis
VHFTGEVDSTDLERLYAQCDLFVLPTLYEGYGMAVAEALAHRMPVISTRVGAITQMVGASAGLLTDPGDAAALRSALERVMDEPHLLPALAAGAAQVCTALPSWSETCAQMAQVLELQDPADSRG